MVPGAEPESGLVATIHEGALDLRHRASHRQEAAELNYNILDLQIESDLAREALHQFRHGVLVIGADTRVLFANRAAERILADPRGALRIERQRLTARGRTNCEALSRLMRVAVGNGTGGSSVVSRDGHPALILLVAARSAADVLRHPGHAIIFVKDLEEATSRSSSAFARHFALTPAQSALANEIVRGDGVGAAARRLRISYGTARAHLLHIFQKTGARRQTELVRLMLEWDDGIGQMADATPGKTS